MATISSLSQLPPNLQPWLNDYLIYLKVERGYSPHTVQNYQRSLCQLADFITESNIDNWSSVEESQLKLWLIDLRKQQQKARSIQLKLSATKGFFNYLLYKNKTCHDPSQLLTAPKADKPLPKNLEVDEVVQLLNFIPEATIEFRDKAMMELFYSSGLRLSELANVQLNDFSSAFDELTVTGKGSKQRIVPVGTIAKQALQQWLTVRNEFNPLQISALFLSKLGKPISVRQIQQRLKHWALKQGLNNTLHPHKLRHSFASHVLESSGNLRAVQELLGHADLSTTQVYTHLDFQHLASVYDKAHPRAKKNQ